jgi:predicted membrane protein
MTTQREFQIGGPNNPLGGIGALVVLILFFVALFFIAKGIFTILSWVAPVLLILTLIIDYKVVLDYGKWIGKLLKNNILVGILAILLTIIGFPVAAGFLFFRAMVRRKLKSMGHDLDTESKQEYTEYEEVVEEEDFLELPPIEKPPHEADSDYDDLFK